MKTAFLFLIALVAMVAVNCWAWVSNAADDMCAGRDTIIAALSDRYHEQPAEAGAAGTQGGIVELLTSRRGDGKPETWTLILTMPNGQSCLIASGEGWTSAKPTAGIDSTKGDGI